jgi:hypothetical protein
MKEATDELKVISDNLGAIRDLLALISREHDEVPRRERIATACLAGYRANPSETNSQAVDVARWALYDADAMIAALDAKGGAT